MDNGMPARPQPTTGRSIGHLLVGIVQSLLGAGLLGLLVIAWGAALISLLGGATGGWFLILLYVLTVMVLPLPVTWLIHEIGVLQRSRFRHLLDVDIAEPSWTVRSTGRQLVYHGWALGVSVPVPVVLLVPAAARWLARRDATAARVLLGPTTVEVLSKRLESVRRSRTDVVLAADTERRRIERDLHDGAQQRLMSLALNLGMAREAITEPSPARDAIVAAHEEAMVALTELRHFVRGLHPAVLEDRGLDAAISGIAARSPIPIDVSVDIEGRCPGAIEAVAYFIVSEALTNVAKHAAAGAASVAVRRHGSRLTVTVTDDGCGGATVQPGGGLAGLAQRAAAVDGRLSLRSPVGGPTVIEVALPCG